jgi:NADPH2:quinone reductase
MMKAIRVHSPGGTEALRYEEVAAPAPGAGQALVRVEVSGVNFIDVYQRAGLYRLALPAVLGQEGAGTILSVGPGVTGMQPGDRVAWASVMGSYAEQAVIAAERLVTLPDGVTSREGAAVMLQGMTAHYLATSTYALKPGDWCLVHAAAGGVGLLLCQIAAKCGATVIGTVGSSAKAEHALGAGAKHVIQYREQDFETETMRLTGGAGVRVVYDSVGRDTFDRSLRCLTRRGVMVLFGQSSGPVPPLDPQVLNQRGSLFLTRPTLAHYTSTRAELLDRANAVLGWVRDGSLQVRIDGEYSLSDAARAHRQLESRNTSGKLLLIP